MFGVFKYIYSAGYLDYYTYLCLGINYISPKKKIGICFHTFSLIMEWCGIGKQTIKKHHTTCNKATVTLTKNLIGIVLFILYYNIINNNILKSYYWTLNA